MNKDQSSQRKLTMEDLDRLLAMPNPSDEESDMQDLPEVTHDRHYLDLAAVVSAYDPFRLVADPAWLPAGERTSQIDRLLTRSEPIVDGPQRGLWSLSLPARREALERMATREHMKQVLASNPEPVDTPVDRMFRHILEDIPLELSSLAREDLAGLVTVVDWTAGILDDLPDKAAIRLAIDRCDLLAPMKRLAGSIFVDRMAEMQQLEHYAFDARPEKPLFVFGPGGVGKSTLLSRVILKAVEERNSGFIYIDIDRPTIRPDRPNTLMIEIVRQLQKQLGIPGSEIGPILKELMNSERRFESSRAFESLNVGFDSSYFFYMLRSFLDRATQKAGQVMIVMVDTFEEAQFLGPDVVQALIDFLFSFAASFQQVRVILSGRTLPEQYMNLAFGEYHNGSPDSEWNLADWPMPGRPINLSILDEESARELLQSALAASGVAALTREELDELVAIVGRNPMCLKLAARLVRDEGVDKLRATPSELLARLKAEKIQAHLYGRILHHIHDQDVRKLAFPGLIVRRITVEIIREVLAKPCKLSLRMGYDAQRIFNDLAREAALVESDPLDGSLRHRSDVRRAMLEDLTDHVMPEVVKQIDRAAVSYYAKQKGAVARAEEIYHRLRLHQKTQTLDKRWLPEAAGYLKGAIEELDAQQRLWLAEKLQITLDDTVRQAASQKAWEDQAARACERFLQSGKPDVALAVLQERPERLPRSNLYQLEAEAYRVLGQFDQALRVSNLGVSALVKAGSVDQALELQLKMVVIEETRQNLEAAWKLLEEAESISASSSNAVLRLRVQITRLRIQRQLRPEAQADQALLRKEALASLTDELLRTLRSYPVLLRETAAELGNEDARISRAAIDTLGLEVATDDQVQALVQAILALNKQSNGDLTGSGWANGIELLEKSDLDAGTIRQWVTTTLSTSDTRQLARILGTSEKSSQTTREWRNYFRAGVDSTLRFSGKSNDDQRAQ